MTDDTITKPADPTTSPNGQHDKTLAPRGQHDKIESLIASTDGQHDGEPEPDDGDGQHDQPVPPPPGN